MQFCGVLSNSTKLGEHMEIKHLSVGLEVTELLHFCTACVLEFSSTVTKTCYEFFGSKSDESKAEDEMFNIYNGYL